MDIFTVLEAAPALLWEEGHGQLSFYWASDFSDPGTEPRSPALAGGFSTTEPPGQPLY